VYLHGIGTEILVLETGEVKSSSGQLRDPFEIAQKEFI
jgi:hypothetical protein